MSNICISNQRGAGTVIGIIDTGVYLQHEALHDAYAGAWHDPYYNTSEPTDQQSHGWWL